MAIMSSLPTLVAFCVASRAGFPGIGLDWSSVHVVDRPLSQSRHVLFLAPGQVAAAKILDVMVEVRNWMSSEKRISADVIRCADNQPVADEAVL